MDTRHARLTLINSQTQSAALKGGVGAWGGVQGVWGRRGGRGGVFVCEGRHVVVVIKAGPSVKEQVEF